jgi:hypothetical protein
MEEKRVPFRGVSMNVTWEETQAKLVSIQHEYNLICRAWSLSTNSQREQQLQALASACLAEVQATVQQYSHNYAGDRERAIGQ